MTNDTSPGTGSEIVGRKQRFLREDSSRLELEKLRGQLLVERSSFFSHWYQLSRFIDPRRSRFFTSDTDKGDRRNMAIVDSTGTLAARTFKGGMMSAFTSPSRPWFRLSTLDPDLAKSEPVKEWLYDNTWRMSEVFLRSNIYTSLHLGYGDIGTFGTAAILIEEDMDRVIHSYPLVIGSYYLIANDKLRVNGMLRDFRLTVRQIIEKFGWDMETGKIDWSNISPMVKSLWDSSNSEAWIEMTHAIVPNQNWNPRSPMSDKKKYVSIYYERGSQGSSNYNGDSIDTNKVLSRKGLDKFRVLAPRWEISGEDIYGTMCPGMASLGDIQQLQVMVKRENQALEKSINPAMVGPAALRSQKASVLPGDITYLDTREGQQRFEPAYQINPNFQQMEVMLQEVRGRIDRCWYKDMWQVISDIEKGNVTAEEIRALKEEKLQEIGPVVDRLSQDLLDPLIENTFDIMLKQGLISPPPPQMAKQPLRIEYTSIMAQAQKALGAATIERFTGYLTTIKELNPEDPATLDKVNLDEAIERYGDELTIPPGIVRDDDEVAQIRGQRQQAQAAQQKMQALEQASNAAKNLAQAPTTGGNALSDLISSGNAGNLQP